MQRSLRAVLIVAVALAGALLPLSRPFGSGARVALACSCNPQPAPSVARDGSAAVFLGRVVASSGAPDAKITFAIERVFKGVLSTRVVVDTVLSGAACGFDAVPVGSRWLVYSRTATPLGMYACSRTRRAEEAAADLAALGAGSAPVASSTPPAWSSSTASPTVATSAASSIASSSAVASAPQVAPRKPGCGGCAQGARTRGDGYVAFATAVLLLGARARRRSP